MKAFCPLASGSKGNATYYESEQCKILIDAGLSYRSLKQRLAEIDVEIDQLDAIFITHEHSDHIRALDQLVKQHNIPIIANSDTAKMIQEVMEEHPRFKLFTTGETFQFEDLIVHPFSIQHDTLDPVAFTIESNKIKLGVCTDLGFVSSLVKAKLKGCHYLIIEANHDIDLLHASQRPPYYKERVLSRQGHLSNEDCAALLLELAHPNLHQVFLAHLSDECNQPDIALQTVRERLEEKGHNIPITIAHQNKVSKKVVAIEKLPA